jgi:hypothetical protein
LKVVLIRKCCAKGEFFIFLPAEAVTGKANAKAPGKERLKRVGATVDAPSPAPNRR